MKVGGIINFITAGGLVPGATSRWLENGECEWTIDGKTRVFTKELMTQLPNPDVIEYIKSCFAK